MGAAQAGLIVERLLGAITAAIVDDDQLPGVGVAGQGLVDGGDKGLDVVDLVVHRHDDGELVVGEKI
jgi:hypothetical protein